MRKIKIVSIDMFRTLVDLGSVEQIIWQMLLKDKYTVALAEECATHAGNALFNNLPQNEFLPLKPIIMECFTGLFSSIGVEFNPVEDTKLWAQLHSLSKPFSDSMPFLNSVGKEYPICLASDADDDMLETLKQMYDFDYVFTSEQLGLYKANADGRFFSEVIKHCGVSSEEIIHIGDGGLEIVGANKAGITTCWLNRTALNWSHHIKPIYEVSSLIEAASVLDIDIDSDKPVVKET
jgi:putative hydrolase of the HAD superfamily